MATDSTDYTLLILIGVAGLILTIIAGVLIYYYFKENKPVSELRTQQKGEICDQEDNKCAIGFECRKNLCIAANSPSGCYYGEFGPFSSCSEVCGGGVQSKTRMVFNEDGTPCNFPPIRESKPCNTLECSTVPQHAGLTVEENVDYFGNDMPNMPIGPFDSVNDCASNCASTDGCQSYSWLSPDAPWVKENPEAKGKCYLKNKVGNRRMSGGIFGGKKVV